ncbi:hypothetical protein O6H91_09G072700 [Diphasiastrum complanatum]|nr:hypothetical protein O6H91_09G072700 [Diphasiastrum complanatum]
MLGTCMLIGDGILTPAISVLSAVSGIQSAASSISNAVVVVLSAVILIAVFMFQRFGTKRVSFLFSPIMAAWLITTPIVGAYNIAKYYPHIFKSFSPHYIILFFSKNGKKGWKMLGGTVLCITGAEAMFADMGHFNRPSIQVAFSTMVYPSVLITYAGQTAYLIRHPNDHGGAFYKSIPHAVYWPMFIIATLAAIVASQGLISAAFSIIKQSVALDYFPRVKLVHTSKKKEGQVYSPEVNYILMILCLAVIFGFRGTNEIGNAFGVAVILVMLITTVLITLVMLAVWQIPLILALSFLGLFGFIEGIYMTAVLVKIPQGGWLPFAVSFVLVTVMLSWNYGRQKKCEYEMKHIMSLKSLGTILCNPEMHRVPGICFFYSDVLYGIPPIVSHYVKIVKSLHQVLVFTTIRCLPVKTVLPHERFIMGGVGYKGVYRCIAQYGYKDIVDAEGRDFLDRTVAALRDYIKSQDCDVEGKETGLQSIKFKGSNSDDHVNEIAASELGMLQNFAAEDLAELEMAKQSGAVFVLGKSRLKVSKSTRWLERIVVDKFYRFLQNNCRSAISTWKIPYSDSLEVGMLYEL